MTPMPKKSPFSYASPPVFKYQTFDMNTVQFTNIPLAERRKAEKEAEEKAKQEEEEKANAANEDGGGEVEDGGTEGDEGGGDGGEKPPEEVEEVEPGKSMIRLQALYWY